MIDNIIGCSSHFQAEEKAIPQYFESMEHLLSFYETKRAQMPIPLKGAIQCERLSLDSEMEDLGSGFSFIIK